MDNTENNGPAMDPQDTNAQDLVATPEALGPGDPPRAGYLHVVFHGLFCFFEEETEIIVRTPRVDHMGGGGMPMPEHVYLAGNWLGEVTYPPGKDYKLTGVEHGYARFPRDVNLVIAGGSRAPNPKGLYAEFGLPYPMQIHSLQSLSVLPLKDFFSGNSLNLIEGVKKISTLQILTYRFHNHLKLALENTPWSANTMLSGNIATLHIWAEPDQKVTESHVKNAFDNAIAMYDKVDLKFSTSQAAEPVKAGDLPFGLRVEEMQDLFLRLRTLAVLGKRFKNGGNLRKAFRPDEALNASDVLRCGQSIGAIK
jgi:hypothetical protein